MKPKRKRDFTGMFIMAVLLSFILPLGYLVVRIVSHGGGTEEVRSREDYVLMLLQCLLGIAAIVLPLRLIRQKTLQIPRVMLVLYIAFLYCAIFLGEVRSFYYAVPRTVLGHDSAHDERCNVGCAWLFHDCDFQQCGAHTVESFTDVHRRICVLLCACDGRGVGNL